MSNSNYANTDYNKNFTVTYIRFSKTITRFLRKIVYDWDIAEELSHDVFLKIFERNVDLDPDSARTANFLLSVAKNTAIDFLRRRKIEEEKLKKIFVEEASLNIQFYNDIGEAYIKGEIISTLSDTLNSFSDNKKEIFIEKNFYKKKYTTIACDLNESTYKIKQINDEIYQKIRENLKHFFD